MIQDISWFSLAMAALLVVANGVLSIVLQLRIEKQMLIAMLRMVVQLFLVGLVLIELFEQVSVAWTSIVAMIMLMFAAYEVSARVEHKFTGYWRYLLGFIAMACSAMVVTAIALLIYLQPDPWYHPRYVVPLLGMILGNTMTGISLALNTLTKGACLNFASVEAQLALGASLKEAMLPLIQDAMKAGLMPIINSMAATGVVYLPGMMTGQILAGVDPAIAVKYQLMIMLLIAGATGLGVLLAVYLSINRLSDDRQRLRLDRLV